ARVAHRHRRWVRIRATTCAVSLSTGRRAERVGLGCSVRQRHRWRARRASRGTGVSMAGSGQAHLRASDEATVLRVSDLAVEFPAAGKQRVQAVSGLSFDLVAGETLGILGESGCGKSSASRAIMQLPAPTAGSVRVNGTERPGPKPKARSE